MRFDSPYNPTDRTRLQNEGFELFETFDRIESKVGKEVPVKVDVTGRPLEVALLTPNALAQRYEDNSIEVSDVAMVTFKKFGRPVLTELWVKPNDSYPLH